MTAIKTTKTKKPKLPANHCDRTPAQVFQFRWEKIEKLTAQVAKAKVKYDQIIERFQNELLPFEQEQSQVQYQLIEKLFTFVSKKSLTQTQRLELLDWIEEILESLLSSPFRNGIDVNKLQQQLTHIRLNDLDTEDQADALNEIRSQLKDHFNLNIEFTDAELMAFLANPELILQHMVKQATNDEQDDLDDNFVDEEDDLFGDETTDFFEQHSSNKKSEQQNRGRRFEQAKKSELFISKGTMNRCYKKLANIFHPDKAQNQQDKDKFHQLMISASKAKKNNDAFTLFSMYQEYVNDKDFAFAENELVQFNEVLQAKVNKLEDEKNEYLYGLGHDFNSHIVRRFKSRSKKELEGKFSEHLNGLQNYIGDIKQTIADIKTLKVVKEILNARYDKMDNEWNAEELFDLMFNK